MEFRLSDLGKGQEGILLEPRAEGLLACRLRQFGMIEGTGVLCLGCSPLGSPMLFRVRGTVLALRREDCREIPVVMV